MHSRQGIINLFSTFLEFEADSFKGWIPDPTLRRSIQTCLEQQPQFTTSEEFWTLYWYGRWKAYPKGLAQRHLAAYLQEPCYWAAKRTSKYWTNSQYQLSDYCQMANAEISKVLEGFNPQQNPNLKTYARIVLPNLLRDVLRQRKEADNCTDWALLRKLSKKRLVESLEWMGLSAASVAQYRLAWVCFKELYCYTQGTGNSKLPNPEPALWIEIARLYNAERPIQLGSIAGPPRSPEMLQQWLRQSAKWARAFLYPRITSLNQPKSGYGSDEAQDDVADQRNDALITELIAQVEAQERTQLQQQLQQALISTMAQLDPQSQRLLELYYGQGLTQQDIAQQLDMKQYTVSRRLTKHRERLLAALLSWSQTELHISLHPNLIKNVSILLEEWLHIHFSKS
ncbi:MAG: sigma-70 family RNA polymerase sigma factor [Leptolyngbyaceae cyanobacterium MO_188.B28]|nr:sigma-70 family RNA polymerase sigma factor [Leptolyngbyaceae cyanobacterium MO_188.B28]